MQKIEFSSFTSHYGILNINFSHVMVSYNKTEIRFYSKYIIIIPDVSELANSNEALARVGSSAHPVEWVEWRCE